MVKSGLGAVQHEKQILSILTTAKFQPRNTEQSCYTLVVQQRVLLPTHVLPVDGVLYLPPHKDLSIKLSSRRSSLYTQRTHHK